MRAADTESMERQRHFFARWPIAGTDRLELAHRLTLEAAFAIGDNELTIWPLDYIVARVRRLMHRQDVELKQALRGNGIKTPKPGPVSQHVVHVIMPDEHHHLKFRAPLVIDFSGRIS